MNIRYLPSTGILHGLVVALALWLVPRAEAQTSPVITTQPQSQTVTVGGTVTFTVIATGAAPLSYQWRKGSAPIASATGAALTLLISQGSDAGPYSVIVSSDGKSVTSSVATLTVSSARELNSADASNAAALTLASPGVFYSADTNYDNCLDLSELLRVIQIFNARLVTTRTGRYKLQNGTEDGFEPDPVSTSNQTLAKYHTADSNLNGQISLLELTRVIELYNTRAGTVRTGQYHVVVPPALPTEDGFAPGP